MAQSSFAAHTFVLPSAASVGVEKKAPSSQLIPSQTPAASSNMGLAFGALSTSAALNRKRLARRSNRRLVAVAVRNDLGACERGTVQQGAMSAQALPGHPSLCFKQLPASDVPQAAVIEEKSYPADEAATPEKLEYRQRVAPELFYGVYEGSTLLAFVVSTAAKGATLEEESMSTHEPGGDSICIHSVVVDPNHRRKGIAREMVKAYVEAVAADTERCGAAKRFLLIAHAPLLGLYTQCGFQFVGPSAVVHGSELWFDMKLDLVAKRQLDFLQADAFTPVALAGNPAAVLFTHRGGDEDWMQSVAIENNLSETAFLERRSKDTAPSEEAWDIRWFTPGGEVDLCGHATLASAHALWDTGRVGGGEAITFHTRRAGALHCSMEAPWIKMDFPAQAQAPLGGAVDLGKLTAAFGIAEADVVYAGQGPATTPDVLLEVSPEAFGKLTPNTGVLSEVKGVGRGVIVTSVGGGAYGHKRPRILGEAGSGKDESYDFVSRFFAPWLGIDEDPVTGSAHCILAPYWAAKLGKAEGDIMLALQASPRGGILQVKLCKDDTGSERVSIAGQAVTVIQGRMAA